MEEGPTSPHQNDHAEEQNDANEVKVEEEHIPTVSAGELYVVHVQCGEEMAETRREEELGHQEVNPLKGALADVAGIEREGEEEGEVSEGEKEQEGREVGVAGGEVVAGSVAVEVEELRVNFHGDGALGDAVCEEEAVFVGDGDGVRTVESSGRGRKIEEGEEVRGVRGIEDAEGRVLFHFYYNLGEGFFAY